MLHGESIDYAGLFLRGLMRLVVFSILGYLVGYGLHCMATLSIAIKGRRIDVTAGEQEESSAPPKPKPVPVALTLAVEHLEPGMKLADAVPDGEGKQLAPSGALLTEEMIVAVKEAGASVLRIEGVKYVTPEAEGEAPRGQGVLSSES